MTSSPSDTPKPSKPTQDGASAATEADLQKALELRRLIGDPRVRVEVPTRDGSSHHPVSSVAKRYSVG